VYESALIARAIEEGVLNETTFIADIAASSHFGIFKELLNRYGATPSINHSRT
jgi:hypothetical protein